MESTVSSSATLEVRIQSAKRAIRDATAQALKFAATDQTDTSTSEINISPDVDYPMSDVMNIDTNEEDINTLESEFDLAMTLFGDDPRGIEEDLSLRLSKVENDLNDYFVRKEQQHQQQQDDNTTHTAQHLNKNTIDYESFGIQPTQSGDVDPATKQHILQQETDQLRSKITFLQKCSEARLALDEANTITLQSSCATGTRTGFGTGGTTRKAAAAMVSVHAAQNLSKAQSALKEAMRSLPHQNRAGTGQNDPVANAITENANMSARDVKVANDIVQSIQSQITRKTVDLHSKATSLIDSCITVSFTSISVTEDPSPATGAGTGTTTIALNDSTNSNTSINTSTSSLDMSKSVSSPSYQGLKAAMDVLTILSEGLSYSRLEDTMQIIADDILATILRPVILEARDALKDGKKTKKFQFEELSSKSSLGTKSQSGVLGSGGNTKGVVFTLEWLECDGKSNDESDQLEWWTDLLQFIQTVTKFICDKVLTQGNGCNCDLDLFPMFGRALLGQAAASPSKKSYTLPFESDIMEHGTKCPIIKLLDRLLWEHCIPESPSSEVLAGLGKIRSAVTESITAFESFLTDSRLIANNTVLQEYANKFDDKYNEKVRSSILVKGRKILLEGDYHDSVRVGVNIHERKKAERPEYLDHIDMEQNDLSLFLFQECGISKVALQLMELCKDTMDLAVDPNTSSQALLSPTLYRASRELLDLFRASIPAVHGNDIATIPRTAAIFHNDCTFFAHKMLSFGLAYRDRFPADENGKESPLKQICTFLDLVPLFRDLAERTMNDMIQFQKYQISEIASPRLIYLGDALGSNEGVVEWSDTETALTAGLYHLRHLSQAWKSMLSHDIYSITMGSIVDALFTLFLDKVLGANDISVPACHFVSGLFQNVLRGISELFGSPASPGEGVAEAAQFCTFHHKFSAVGKFMDMSLVDINIALSEGVFRSVTGAELSRLVCAVFKDTESRRNLLRLLESN